MNNYCREVFSLALFTWPPRVLACLHPVRIHLVTSISVQLSPIINEIKKECTMHLPGRRDLPRLQEDNGMKTTESVTVI
jgi:hypothetical protein